MKTKLIVLLLALCCSNLAICQEDSFPEAKKEAVSQLLKKYIAMGIPGLSVSVYTPKTGMWSQAEGYANMENKVPLTTNHVHYLQSVSKTYMATIILMLVENGKINLSDNITKFLDYKWLKDIEGTDLITIKMLLNHTSGLPEYSTDPLLVSQIIQNPLQVLTVEQMLSFIGDKELLFKPGSSYQYRNTNYALLSLVADKITGNHIDFLQVNIIEKLGLSATFYLSQENYKNELNLVDAYWDVLQEDLPVNISKLQLANVASMKGDDGLVASSKDAVKFMQGLVSGALLKPSSLALMQEWVSNEEKDPKYGLGLTYFDLDVTYGIGHSGGGVGAGCVLIYLPELEAIVFIATNFNTMMDSPLRKRAENLQLDILSALFME